MCILPSVVSTSGQTADGIVSTLSTSMVKETPNPAPLGDPGQVPIAPALALLELSHRIRNIFAVMSGLVAISARGRPELRPFVRVLQERIEALAAAHNYIAPQDVSPTPSAHSETVKNLLSRLTAPYKGELDATVVVRGDDAPIGLRAAGVLALIVQELATNAVKYGALSQDGGTVTIFCTAAEGRYAILWREAGGPRLTGGPDHAGFGASLCDTLAVSAGFGLRRTWRPEGLEVSMSSPLEGLGV
jgi:two-component sensor histidine kinase